MITSLPSGLLVVETPEPEPPSPPKPPAGHPRCQTCGAVAPESAPMLGGMIYESADRRWFSERWTCRHGATWECPDCQKRPREERLMRCPVCGEGESLT